MKQLKFETLADFKRKAEVGVFVKGGYYDRNNEEYRKIIGKQSNAVRIETERNGQKIGSYFDYPKASVCEIEDEGSGSVLKIYEDRVRFGNSDIPADASWFEYNLESGKIKESEVERYKKQVAEYRLYENC